MQRISLLVSSSGAPFGCFPRAGRLPAPRVATRTKGGLSKCGYIMRLRGSHLAQEGRPARMFLASARGSAGGPNCGENDRYCVTVNVADWLLTPPTETTTGWTPRAAAKGAVKLICTTPTNWDADIRHRGFLPMTRRTIVTLFGRDYPRPGCYRAPLLVVHMHSHINGAFHYTA